MFDYILTALLLFIFFTPAAGSPPTYALHEGWVETICEKRLRQLPEVQLECSCDGVDVHVTQHQQDVFGICESQAKTDPVRDRSHDLIALSQ